MQTLLCSAYLAPISFFATACRNGGDILIERYDNYNKQTYRNRCIIATANGRQTLTVPIEKQSTPKTLMKDVRISRHGDWRHLHWNALESAYMNSPFYMYYQDDLRPFYEKHIEYLIDLNMGLTEVIMGLIGMKSSLKLTNCYSSERCNTQDLRILAEPDCNNNVNVQPYYQVFRKRYGFLENLSIVDLLFNMGPESLPVLMGVQR